MESSLVSIIIPCYNSEAYLGRCFDSILNQTHKNIEVICVNDGSTDGTQQVILEYEKTFAKNKEKFIHLKQENLGQAAACAYALKYFSGEYLCWLDSDDFLTPRSLEKRVSVLERNPKYGIALCDCFLVNEDAPLNVIALESEDYGSNMNQEWQFTALLAGRAPIKPLMYMARSASFLQANPLKYIFAGRAGQNFQMLLPVLYRFRCLYINEPLGYYVKRPDSHSRIKRTPSEELERLDDILEIIHETLKQMELPQWEIERYIRMSYVYKSRVFIANQMFCEDLNCQMEYRENT
jgi:glycosyltransferase involved in cell wall biosynthesis